MIRCHVIALFLWALGTPAYAIIQTAQLDVSGGGQPDTTYLVSQASFGPSLPMGDTEGHRLALPPSDNPLMCQNITDANAIPKVTDNSFIFIIPRGECTFEVKTHNAQRLGASGVIIEGTLESRYTMNETTNEVIYPQDKHDYDCAKGRAEIPSSALSFPPYDAEVNDPALSGDTSTNLCLKNSPDYLASCESNACLLTGGNVTTDGMLEACCAWDLHIWLYYDPSMKSLKIEIPSVYVTMAQGHELHQRIGSTVKMSERPRAAYNLSAILIWMLGVLVAAVASYASAADYHTAFKSIISRGNTGQDIEDQERSALTNGNGPKDGPLMASSSYGQPEESLELSAGHALGFIVMASSGLLILFFFKIYGIVKIMYGFGCSRAIMQVIFLPIFGSIFSRLKIRNRLVYNTNIEDIGEITTLDIVAGAVSYTLGATWLYLAFTLRHPDTNVFFWVMQDVMGACMCVLFLGTIKLNSMRVATILLVVAFFYDIFFVFVTPLLFKGQSVMITVATSGGPPKADPLWCEKYPDDANCQGGDPLPMLFTVPRIDDYQGGSSLLGLGDIVLPGLLLSFAARLDAAKQLLAAVSGHSNKTCCSHNSYFYPSVVAYAIGLLMANAAVYLMNMGQPALLYLVPMTVGTLSFLGWRRKELAMLWEGPKIIRTADVLLYGPEYEGIPQDEDTAQGDKANANQHASNLVT
eukprot:CAMPEP_0194208276 /NCGR_PEP_ID=MMETSP0156-20130528/6766_1 /TAXON_ID=33649 /ORGANISM="Thalassionema nitzschioides, Strain L26-B" /LENGTH=695 /DNA_ID=CAMNT_0038935207 /DNA_START=236 /DNA_END=2323 /DNA_ORIENTATION=+